jgi:hypothetical protein
MRHYLLATLVLLAGCGSPIDDQTPVEAEHVAPDPSDADGLTPFVTLALDCAEQEYPNKIAHTMTADADLAPPRDLHPAFYGCFDWHSSVHGHWLLARYARAYPEAPLAEQARAVLDRHLTPARIAGEVDYFDSAERGSWERPYGLAWLLQLAAELYAWADEGDVDAQRWAAAIRPLEDVCVDRFLTWLPKLAYPIRTGEHSQTAFAFGLALDYARTADDPDLAVLIEEKSLEFYLGDRDANLAYEPSGQDFLSPVLAEADLMSRLLTPAEFGDWLGSFLPGVAGADWLPVARVTDRSDGKLAHLDGLNLSRAWMLRRIAAALPEADPRRAVVHRAQRAHARAGLAAVTGEHYAGGHWLGTYAIYLLTSFGTDTLSR